MHATDPPIESSSTLTCEIDRAGKARNPPPLAESPRMQQTDTASLPAVHPTTRAQEQFNALTQVLVPASQTLWLLLHATAESGLAWPPAWAAVAVNSSTWIHCFAAVNYHLRCAYRLDKHRLENHARRCDQAFIHFTSAVYAFALSGSPAYGLATLAYNAPCIALLWRPLSWGAATRARIGLAIMLYLAPMERGARAVAAGAFAMAATPLLLDRRLAGWGHGIFHLGLVPYGLIIQQQSAHRLGWAPPLGLVAACAALASATLLIRPPGETAAPQRNAKGAASLANAEGAVDREPPLSPDVPSGLRRRASNKEKGEADDAGGVHGPPLDELEA